MNSNEYRKFTKKFFDLSWRYARYYLEYETKKEEFNELKNIVFDEYVKKFQNLEYNFKEANILACKNINYSHRIHKKYEELLKIKKYRDIANENYNYLYPYYNSE